MRRALYRATAATKDEAGTTFIEYIVVAAVAVVLILGAIQAFFGGVADLWNRVTAMIAGAG